MLEELFHLFIVLFVVKVLLFKLAFEDVFNAFSNEIVRRRCRIGSLLIVAVDVHRVEDFTLVEFLRTPFVQRIPIAQQTAILDLTLGTFVRRRSFLAHLA